MRKRRVIRLATCQFAVSANLRKNAEAVREQMKEARRRRADVAHFPECALCGYPGADMDDLSALDWDALRAETQDICRLARELGLWVILGSAHRLSGRHKPHNSVYIINSRGRIIDRYDKRFCTGGDLKHFSPGDHFPVFTINGVRCGTLICFDLRFPELYRAYKRLGVEVIFQSFYNARAKESRTIWTTIMRPTIQAHAGINSFWISAPNASGRWQGWPSVLVQPDGVIVASLRFNKAGVMVNTIDARKEFYDPSRLYRERAMRGILHSGRLVRDPRSRNRTAL